jgi:hypothetical protein
MRFGQEFFHSADQLRLADGFLEHGVGAQADLFRALVGVAENEDRQEWVEATKEVECFADVDIRDVEVEESGVKRFVEGFSQGFVACLGPNKLITLAMQCSGNGPVSGLFIFDNENSWFHNSKRFRGESPAGRSGANPQAHAARLALCLRGCSGSRSLTMASHHNNLPRQRMIAVGFVENVYLFTRLQVSGLDGLGSPGSLLLQEFCVLVPEVTVAGAVVGVTYGERVLLRVDVLNRPSLAMAAERIGGNCQRRHDGGGAESREDQFCFIHVLFHISPFFWLAQSER